MKLRTQDIQFEQADERFKGHIEVAFVQIAKDGLIVGGIKDDVELALLPASYDQSRDRGWLYPRNISISPAAEKLRVVVRDVATGQSARSPFPSKTILAADERSGPVRLFFLELFVVLAFLAHFVHAAQSTVGVHEVETDLRTERIDPLGFQVGG